jgi:6-phospho-3-hexuloisomerase
MRASLDYILKEMKEALSRVDSTAVEEAIKAFCESDKIFIYGVGRSGLVGQAFAVRLVQIGFDVHFVGDMTTPFVDARDVVIIVSNTGETMSAVQTANIVRRVGAKVVSITSAPNSKLGHASNIILEVGQSKDEPIFFATYEGGAIGAATVSKPGDFKAALASRYTNEAIQPKSRA